MTSASDILDGLIAISDDKIWATELALLSGTRRIDFWTLEPAASQGFRATAYEIKISRADFHRDDEDKQAGARQFSDRFWYATPEGLIRKDELPAWAGLIEWDGKCFLIKKRAPKLQKTDPTWEFVVSILRNSGEQRRDVGLMKAQIAFFQASTDRARRQDTFRNQMMLERWKQKAALTTRDRTKD